MPNTVMHGMTRGQVSLKMHVYASSHFFLVLSIKKKKWSCLITAITKKSSGGQICPPPGTDPNFFNPVQIGLILSKNLFE